jgi:hypothetical protein
MRNNGAAWLRFFGWSLVGACLALGISAIGVFTVPVGLLLAVALTPTHHTGRELLGLLEGAGAVSAFVGVVNLRYRPCPNGPVVLAPGQDGFSCGGFDGEPWLIAGIAVMAAAAVLYWRLSRRPPPEQRNPRSSASLPV